MYIYIYTCTYINNYSSIFPSRGWLRYQLQVDPIPQWSFTHWGRVTHICVGKLIIIGSDSGLSPDRRQVIIWTNAGILLIGTLGTKFREILIEIITFSFKKMRLKLSSAKRWPFCLGLNELMGGFNRIFDLIPKIYWVNNCVASNCRRTGEKSLYDMIYFGVRYIFFTRTLVIQSSASVYVEALRAWSTCHFSINIFSFEYSIESTSGG